MEKINKYEFETTLNKLEKINVDHGLESSLHGDYHSVYYCKGFDGCIDCLKDIYSLKKDIDISNIIRYL